MWLQLPAVASLDKLGTGSGDLPAKVPATRLASLSDALLFHQLHKHELSSSSTDLFRVRSSLSSSLLPLSLSPFSIRLHFGQLLRHATSSSIKASQNALRPFLCSLEYHGSALTQPS